MVDAPAASRSIRTIKEATGNDLEVFEQLWKTSCLYLKYARRNYQVPVEVRPERRTTLGLRWLVTIARHVNTSVDCLAKEILMQREHWCSC